MNKKKASQCEAFLNYIKKLLSKFSNIECSNTINSD